MKIFLFVSFIFGIFSQNYLVDLNSNPEIIFLATENPEYTLGVKNPDASILADKKIFWKILYIEEFGQFVELPHHLANFVQKWRDISFVWPTSAMVDSYIFIRNSENNLLQNTAQINENTNISLVVRTNYGTGILNNQDENIYEKILKNNEILDINGLFLDEKFSESWVFLWEEIVWKCIKLRCEFPQDKLPILMQKDLQNPDTAYWFAEDREYIEKIFFENNTFIIIFAENADLQENFIFHFAKVW